MSTTRSPSRKAPATSRAGDGIAGGRLLLLVGHGSTRSAVARDTLQRHAVALQGTARFADVRIGMLRGAPALEDVLADLSGRAATVLPLFMSDGYLAQDELPRRLAGGAGASTTLTVLPPIGTSALLAGFAVLRAGEAARAAGLDPVDCVCLLVAHGNANDPRSRAAAEQQRDTVAAAHCFADVRTAYIEEAPGVGDVLGDIDRPVVALGLFAAEGKHAASDVPAQLAQIAEPPVIWLGAIGADPAFARVLADHVAAATAAG